MAAEVLVTHRGVMSTTLFCTACHHGWAESSAIVATAARTERRAVARSDSADRRSQDRLSPPTCTYCSTDAHVRSTRRTPEEVFFVCSGCEAMWVRPRPNSRSSQPSSDLG
jgi:hypothetical protein